MPTMKTILQNAQAYQPGGMFKRANLLLENGALTELPWDKPLPAGATVRDASACYAIPALLDLHTHGCAGVDWMDADANGTRKITDCENACGIGSLCATTVAAPLEDIEAASLRIAGAKNRAIVGLNIEGPFLSPQKAGAQNPGVLRSPDAAFILRLAEKTNGLVKLVSVAPELPGALDFIREISSRGIVCSVAHTTADHALAKTAFEAGARHVTHLFNAMPPFLHREPGVIGAAADNPDVTVELICDGVHLHPSVVRAAFKIFGADRVTMVSDSMAATGFHGQAHRLGGLDVVVSGREARLREGGALAGSVTNLMECLRVAVREMGVPLADAVRAAAETPARVIGLPPPRNALLLDADLNLIP